MLSTTALGRTFRSAPPALSAGLSLTVSRARTRLGQSAMRSTNAINYSRPLRYSDPPPAPWPEWRPAPALDFGFVDTITINADGLRITDAPRKSSTENFVGHLDAFLAETEGAFCGLILRRGRTPLTL